MEISIRRAEIDDYEAIADVYAQPGTIAGTLQLPFASREMWKQRLTQAPQTFITLVAVVEEQIVGTIGVGYENRPRRRHVGEFGMGVRDDCQGKGVGSALLAAAVDLADNWLQITRMELTVFVDNERAVKLYKRFGFEVEGTHRQYAFRDGTYVDAYAMARIRPA